MATPKPTVAEMTDSTDIGSGFFVVSIRTNEMLAITCNHVVVAAVQAKKDILAGADTDQGFRSFRCRILYTNETNDVAVLLPQMPSPDLVNVTSSSVRLQDFDDGSWLVLGRGAMIIGYPLRWDDH
jgi:hypothetical protein